MASHSEVVGHFKGKFYQRYVICIHPHSILTPSICMDFQTGNCYFPFVFFLRSTVYVAWRVELFKMSVACSLLFTECAFYATDIVEILMALYPLEIQALFYFALCAREVLTANDGTKSLVAAINNQLNALSFHVKDYYWGDMKKINEICRYHTEEYSQDAINKFNIYPDQIPSWLVDWIPEDGGYLIGNLQPAHIDF